MLTAKVFDCGRNQVIIIPKECRFTATEVVVNKIADIVILLPEENAWSGFISGPNLFTEDVMDCGREQPQMQKRNTR